MRAIFFCIVSSLLLSIDCSKFGSGADCVYPCHCSGNDICDSNTGTCPNGCYTDNRHGFWYKGDWSGPGCQVGNIAYGMSARQGPQTLGYPATLALDGNINPTMERHHCAHPNAGRRDYPWWEVIFDDLYVILNVTIFNRISSYDGAKLRLQDTMVEVSEYGNDSYAACHEIGTTLSPNYTVVEAECSRPVLGKKLRLRRFGGHDHYTMNFCEVFVYGYLYRECQPGYFGPGCLDRCQCLGACELLGYCPTSCISGKKGPTCQDDCAPNEWGSRCSNTCQCRDEESCDVNSGVCANGCTDYIVGNSCNISLPSLEVVVPSLTGTTQSSATLRFETLISLLRGKTKPTGYRLQYYSKSSMIWLNGTQMTHDDWPDSNATNDLHSYYLTQNELDEGMHYRMRVVPLLLHDGLLYPGVPSREVYVTIPHDGTDEEVNSGVLLRATFAVAFCALLLLMALIVIQCVIPRVKPLLSFGNNRDNTSSNGAVVNQGSNGTGFANILYECSESKTDLASKSTTDESTTPAPGRGASMDPACNSDDHDQVKDRTNDKEMLVQDQL